jgi:Tol biopolymer transport system component
MRRIIAFFAAAALATSLAVFAAPTAEAKTTKPTPISVAPATPTQGKPFIISGKIGTKVKRPVTAQYKSGSSWKTLVSGKTTAKGAYQLTATTSASSLAVRVVAKKVKIKHKTYKKVTTKTRTITTRAPALPVTTLVSGSAAVPANVGSDFTPAISADGRYVAFASPASNLVASDTNSNIDVFVRDRSTGVTTRASVTDGGAQANSRSTEPSITPSGRYVAFSSLASNLVYDDTNGGSDIFVRDRLSNATTLVSVATNGASGNGASLQTAMSSDGRYVAFASYASNLVSDDTNYLMDVFVRDLVTHTTTLVSAGVGAGANGDSRAPAISADGRYVAFDSRAENLVSGDTNYSGDVFVRDLATGVTTLVSVSNSGIRGNKDSTAPSISADGRYVAFTSDANNLVSGDTNDSPDVFVRDLVAGTTTRVSVSATGAQADAPCVFAAMSADGRYVSFNSGATTLINDGGGTGAQSDVFVRDLRLGTTTRVSVAMSGAKANNGSFQSAISADGSWIAFLSSASNLVVGDTNNLTDVFERGPLH